ncbi:ABC1 family-domain-containing protein [Pelagophyceae sp. CCMP2097]|nr:ABC1 family-domain-containing protein [Pelagophyceae sp. CCMP2097]
MWLVSLLCAGAGHAFVAPSPGPSARASALRVLPPVFDAAQQAQLAALVVRSDKAGLAAAQRALPLDLRPEDTAAALASLLEAPSALANDAAAALHQLAPAFEAANVPALAAGGIVLAMCYAGVQLLDEYDRRDFSRSESVYGSSKRYAPEAAARFFERRRLQTAKRGAQILSASLKFGAGVVVDGGLPGDAEVKKERQRKRAAELVTTLTGLGPTFVKVGQALSMRSDLLPAAYCDALVTLQDAVQPFDNDEAKRTIADGLGATSLGAAFKSFGDKPIASASLGQVYRAQLFDGTEVAVKVQRPGVAETIALDLHLLRVAAPAAKGLLRANTDFEGIVDAWGVRFVDELDYLREADNAESFSAAIMATPLAGAVFAPDVISERSSSTVLTTKWVTGARLDRAPNADVSKLCSVAMNTYLTMMLETGILHADPHPGNLLVEEGTGRLAILDWGLVTELDPSLRLAYIEHIAHLVAKDYKEVPSDLVKLGFVPAGYEAAIASSDAVEVLTEVYGQFAGGGGGKKIDVAAVLGELRDLSSRQGNIFQLPPYFAYIARAFSVLEGIGLTNDPDYAIVGECLPYVSQRLLSDPSPRVANALETFVYTAPSETRPRAVDATRLEYLLDGFGSYTASTESGPTKTQDSAPEAVIAVAEQLAALLFMDGATASPLQNIVETEMAKLLGASSRVTASRLRDLPLARGAAFLLDPLGIFAAIAQGPLIQPSRADTVALAT